MEWTGLGGGERIRAMLRKEIRQFLRDPFLVVLVLWLYTAEVVLCAVSLTFDLNNEPIGVLDLDRSPQSLQFAEKLDLSPSFRIRYRPTGEREVRSLLDRGDARMVAVIPPGFGERLLRLEASDVQVLIDGAHPVIANTALGEVRRLMARSEATHALTSRARLPGVEHRSRIWYNATLSFAFSVVITMIGAGAFAVGVVYPTASIVKEKESGTIEQLLISPLRTYELIAAKGLATLAIGLVSLVPSLIIATTFGVPFRGDLVTLAIVSAAFLLSAIGIGVLISSLVRTLQQALLSAFFVIFPLAFLSGTMTPIDSMPRALQLLTRINPLRYYEETLFGILLKGVGLEVLWPQLLWMLGMGAVLFAGSMVLFRRRLA